MLNIKVAIDLDYVKECQLSCCGSLRYNWVPHIATGDTNDSTVFYLSTCSLLHLFGNEIIARPHKFVIVGGRVVNLRA
jgi:hypothetical protein